MSDSATLVEISELKEHELIRPDYLEELKEKIREDGILKLSIAVDRNTNVILDGHHRLNALKELGCTKIPVTFIDYESPEIIVQAWRIGETITKDMVISTALKGEKMPPKTSRHFVRNNGEIVHISIVEKMVNMPLEKLKQLRGK